MTERERWIVYPLLFLALGAALRDKLSEKTISKVILCQELVVTGEGGAGREGEVLVHMGSVKRTSADSPLVGQITVNGFIQASEIHAEAVLAAKVNADNYFFRQLPFGQLLLGDILRVLQHQAASAAANAAGTAAPTPPPQQPTPPAAETPVDDADADAEAKTDAESESSPPAE
jgi:hypothetical protein